MTDAVKEPVENASAAQKQVGRRLMQLWQLVGILCGGLLIGVVLVAFALPGALPAADPNREGKAFVLAGFLIVLLFVSIVAGCGIGLLFGVPRMRTDPILSALSNKDAPNNSARALYTNTNLERISDWLTNGIVALTLVNLNKLGDFLAGFGAVVSEQLFGLAIASVLAQVIVVFGSVLGFMFGYIQTRTALAQAFYAMEDLFDGFERPKLEMVASQDSRRVTEPRKLEAIADARTSLGKMESAVDVYKRVVQLQPGNAEALRKLNVLQAGIDFENRPASGMGGGAGLGPVSMPDPRDPNR